MLTAARDLLSRVVLLGVSERDDEDERLRKATTNIIAMIVTGAAPWWALTYVFLDRPWQAAIPGAYSIFSAGALGWIAWRGRVPGFTRMQLLLIAVLPVALQASLGGFEQGSMVSLWAFAAPLLALVVFGAGSGVRWFVFFAAMLVVSGLFESSLRDRVEPLPSGAQATFFVLNTVAPLSAVLLALAYFVRQRDAANARTDDLLGHILPGAVIARMKRGEAEIADRHEEATVLFADIVGFTAYADAVAPERIVSLLSRAFGELDRLTAAHGLEKIKTLGDGYLAVAGVTSPRSDHAAAAVAMALAVEPSVVRALGEEWPEIHMRVGLATGPVMAGVIGSERFGFDVWGDTVNTASRMSGLAEPGGVLVTEVTCTAIEDGYQVERREAIEVKGKGLMTTYVVLGPRSEGSEGASVAGAASSATQSGEAPTRG